MSIEVILTKEIWANNKKYLAGEMIVFQEEETIKAQQLVESGSGEYVDIGKELSNALKIVENNFPDAIFETKVLLSAVATLLLKDLSNPIGLIFVGNPSNIKTTVISFGYGLDGITFKSDDFSPKAFVSHATNVSEEKLEEIDLLPKIKDNVFLIPEMAPVFSKRKEDLVENIGILTRIFDGEGLERDSGARGHRGYTGKYLFVMVGATTPLGWHIWDILGKLGNRWLFLNVEREEKTEEELIQLIQDSNYLAKLVASRQAIHVFVKDRLFFVHPRYSIDWDKQKDKKQVLKYIVKSCSLLRKLRAPLQIYESKTSSGIDIGYEYSAPLIEGPERVLNVVSYLAKGHAIIHGRNYLTEEELPLIFRVVFSSMPKDRADLFKLLVE